MSIAQLAELQPEPVAELENVCEVARRVADSKLLTLCLGRAEAMLSRSGWTEPQGLGKRELAYLDFTEQFVTSVSTVSDGQVAKLLDHDPPEAVYAFIGALYALEMRHRLDLVSSAVLA